MEVICFGTHQHPDSTVFLEYGKSLWNLLETL